MENHFYLLGSMDWIGAQLSDIDAEFKTAVMLKKNRFNLLLGIVMISWNLFLTQFREDKW